MDEECIFCKIIRREVPASLVFEDDKALAFLDISPANKGHTLVIPKRHLKNIYEIPDEDLGHLFETVKKVTIAVKKAVDAEGITIIQQNEKAAGQDVFHLHVHVIPRHGETRLPEPHEIPEESRDELTQVSQKIKQFIC